MATVGLTETGAREVAAPAYASPRELITELSRCFFERDQCINALVTAAIAGAHSFVLGPPGTAKSDLARALAGAFHGSYFEYLMTRFTVPDEIFGPIKLSGLKQDRFARQLNGYMPTADFVFLDEIWKSNSSILNALLTITNEGIIHDDGKPVKVPLVALIAASNELPDGAELDAIYDRFLVRVCVDYIVEDSAFMALLDAPPARVLSRVDIRAERARAKDVVVSVATKATLTRLRKACNGASVIVSDRRWRKCLDIVKASAHVAGRSMTEAEDLRILENVLWRKPDERAAVSKLIQAMIGHSNAQVQDEVRKAKTIEQQLRPAPEDPAEASVWAGEMAAAARGIRDIMGKIAVLPSNLKVDEAYLVVKGIHQRIAEAVSIHAAGSSLETQAVAS